MVNDLRLVGDIGGTNARFAIVANGGIERLRHVNVSQFTTLQDALGDYLDALPADNRPTLAALAVAGPVLGDQVRLTNSGWAFSIAETKSQLKLSSLLIVNDFAATAMAVPYIPKKDLYAVGPDETLAQGPVGIIGPGTGLGVSTLIPHGKDWILLSGEGGHSTLPAVSPLESQIIEYLRKRWDHVSAERVLSGAGLVNVYQALSSIKGIEAAPMSPADITAHAVNKSDQTCVETFEIFCDMLGTVAGDLALTAGTIGGVYIAGGILLRFKEAFAASGFRARFENKGRFQNYLRKIPTHLILEESPALLGLSRIPLP